VSALDLVVVAGYFLGITAFGATFGRFTRTTRDFFLAGQRFPAWLVAFSCVATVVGSYSFIKYSAAGFRYGLASSQTYLNDWFWIPLFLFGWFPLVYHARILSVPEYFRRRFNRATGIAATCVLLMYLLGYIGINLFTLGTALESLFGVPVLAMAAIVTLLCMVYEWTGGQTSVIFTDFVQGVLLLCAGVALAALGVAHVGGMEPLIDLLPDGFLQPLAEFNDSPAFNFVGIFWQDGLAGGVAFYFLNQGILMRFLSARSIRTGRRAAVSVVLVLMPLAAIAVSGAGWIGTALAARGDIAADTRPDEVFVVVARLLCAPGLFGFVMAALLAALMSTVDTLINASSALLINDVYRPLIRPGRDERHYLRAARWTSLGAAIAGLALVPLYGRFDTIYEAHGAFIAAVTPPLAVALILALVWRRFTATAALITLVGGTMLMFASLAFPQLVAPFAHGIPADGGYKYIRAFYGVAVSLGLALIATPWTAAVRTGEAESLTVYALAKRPLGGKHRRIPASAAVSDEGGEEGWVTVDAATLKRLERQEGAEIFVDDARWWLGGLRSTRGKLRIGASVQLPREAFEQNGWRDGQPVILETVD
jgi:SSS family solute:Na+ symporter